jgi:ribosomal protein S18 acetylase RimI-like enzyme
VNAPDDADGSPGDPPDSDSTPPPDVRIREAAREDVPAIRRIASAGWRAAYGEFLGEDTVERVLAEWYDPETVTRAVDDPDVVYLVAVSTAAEERPGAAGDGARTDPGTDDAVVGYVSGKPRSARYGSGSSFYVAPDRWGEGIGSALFERLLDALREEGVERVEFEVLAANEHARGFYERRGFEVVGRSTDDPFGSVHPVAVYARDV